MAERQQAFMGSNKAILNRSKELMETIKTQGEELKVSRTLIPDNTRQRTYGKAIASSGTYMCSRTSQTGSYLIGS